MAPNGRTDVLRCDALFLSDLHLGSNQCEAGHLAAFLGCIEPRELFLVGDIIDLQAIRFNAHVDDCFLTGLIDDLMEGKGEELLADRELKRRNLLRSSHREVLNGLRHLLLAGTRITYIPGNHDAYLRRFAGFESGGLAIRREATYTTPAGQRLLVRHGDEYDGLVHLHGRLAGALAHLQEHYSGWVNGALGLLDGRRNGADPAGRSAELILQNAVELLARHREWPIPVSRGLNSSGGFSLAFALESALKGRTGHDRLIKRRIVRHLQRQGQGSAPLDGLINGHTHIPEATALALPAPQGGSDGPCHITYYNTGSWARSQRRLGRTGLVVAENGTIGMVRFDRRHGIEPFQPPRFPFNTYPMRPCPGCGGGGGGSGGGLRQEDQGGWCTDQAIAHAPAAPQGGGRGMGSQRGLNAFLDLNGLQWTWWQQHRVGGYRWLSDPRTTASQEGVLSISRSASGIQPTTSTRPWRFTERA